VSIHVIGVAGLILIFLVGTLRPINPGALALAMTFIVGSLVANESLAALYSGFPADLLVLLVGVTYLFGVAARNGTIERIVDATTGLVGDRRALVPWIVFVVAALPTTAGALGSAGVALLAPIALRLAQRYGVDSRMMGLMVLHGAACGNFSPLNVLGAIVYQTVERTGLELPVATLFLVNIAYNVVLGFVIYVTFGGLRLVRAAPLAASDGGDVASATPSERIRMDQVVTLGALIAVAVAALCFDLSIGFLAVIAAVTLHLAFPKTSAGAESGISWSVVLLVCGIVTYVAALQRFGTVDAIGTGIASLGSPLLGALLICAVGALASAFASSAGILGAMMLLAVPFISEGGAAAAGLVVALSISATVVDSCPFSTAGALVVANAESAERDRVYRGLLLWGAAMVVTAPVLTWLFFVILSA
jgi:di/tricarboxylate transporter